jgi:hypothetical protein
VFLIVLNNPAVCDEINLPAVDQYQTVAVITFLRQIAEHGGFWRAADLAFIKLDRIQFIGACNPPTDAGRVPLSPRFLRHCPLLFVDFPAVPSLRQIYGTFNRALLKLVPSLRSQAEPLTEAMIDVYVASQARFTPDQQPHYIYSPRELSRWVRAMYEAMKVRYAVAAMAWLCCSSLLSAAHCDLFCTCRFCSPQLMAAAIQPRSRWTVLCVYGCTKPYVCSRIVSYTPKSASGWMRR